MSSLISDALWDPSKILADLYQQHKSDPLETFPSTVTAHFRNIFESQDALKQIPALDVHHPPESFSDRALVVFNGMVQDTSMSQDLYLAVRAGGQCGGWGIADDPSSEGPIDHSNLRESSIFWAVSIPGISDWCYPNDNREATQTSSYHQPHKYPIIDVAHVGVQLRIHDDNIAQPIRTTDLLSFVGILTSEVINSSLDYENTVVVPTLHVLFATSIPKTIIPRSFPEPSLLSEINSLRSELIDWIAQEGLVGDRVAAEWVLLSAISRTRSRQPPVMPLSLTISSFPACINEPNATPALYHVLSQIFPLVVTLPLALDTLNKGIFFPVSKDEDLHSGYLQQPKGSIILFTEGAVTEGGIFEQGAKNILAAQEMMKSQTVDYVFPYSNFSFETDVNFMVVTDGKKSTFFKTDVNIPFRPTKSSWLLEDLYRPAHSIRIPSQDKLLRFRQLVGGSKVGNTVLADSLGQHVEDDFVRERSGLGEASVHGVGTKITPNDLIIRMLVARLISLSLHQPEVTIDVWNKAKDLERQSKARDIN